MPRARNYDQILFLTVVMLIGLGLVMVYSSSALVAEGSRYQVSPFYFLKKQALYAGLAMLVLFCTMSVPYGWWRTWTYVILLSSLILLMLVFLPALGRQSGGAMRWLNLAGITFQPAEIAKFALMLYLAHFLTKKAEAIGNMKAIFLPLCIVLGFSLLLIVKQPDLGTSVLVMAVAFALIFAAGARKSHLFGLGLLFLTVLAGRIYLIDYQWRRIVTFLDPWKDPKKGGYQIIQSLCALGTGGWFGLGLGQGIQKRGYLPEAHTDFIFSVIGEELGLIGALAVLVLFGVFIWRGFRISRQSKDPFACYLALGVTCLIGLQALINVGVAAGVLPTKGLPLPFVSYGGSSLVVNAVAAGILLNISQHA
ncbi:MAG: putative lipid II flippase FtsW [bacterium]